MIHQGRRAEDRRGAGEELLEVIVPHASLASAERQLAAIRQDAAAGKVPGWLGGRARPAVTTGGTSLRPRLVMYFARPEGYDADAWPRAMRAVWIPDGMREEYGLAPRRDAGDAWDDGLSDERRDQVGVMFSAEEG